MKPLAILIAFIALTASAAERLPNPKLMSFEVTGKVEKEREDGATWIGPSIEIKNETKKEVSGFKIAFEVIGPKGIVFVDSGGYEWGTGDKPKSIKPGETAKEYFIWKYSGDDDRSRVFRATPLKEIRIRYRLLQIYYADGTQDPSKA